jgi:hypothetical protein
LNQFRNLITFKIASPDRILKYFFPGFSIEEYLKASKERFTSAQESSGFKTKNFYENMMTYIFILLLIIGFFVIIFLLAQCKIRYKERLMTVKK